MSSSSSFTATIPEPSGNPFIKDTTLPEGTLFIAVGSILLGFIVLVLAWRAYTIYMSYRIAAGAEARFTALEPEYGGPFVDPVQLAEQAAEQAAEELETPQSHPMGVPLKFRRGKLQGRTQQQQQQQTKSLADKSRDAHLKGKFFSPTTEVLLHGNASSGNNGSNNGYSHGLTAPLAPAQVPAGFHERDQPHVKKVRPPSAYLDDLLNE